MNLYLFIWLFIYLFFDMESFMVETCNYVSNKLTMIQILEKRDKFMIGMECSLKFNLIRENF